MARRGKIIFALGVPGTGKTTFVRTKIMPVHKRNLVIPANRYDKAWFGMPKINVEAIVKRLFKGTVNMRSLNELKRASKSEDRLKLYQAIGKAFQKIQGDVLLVVDSKTDILFDIAIDDVYGFKGGGLIIDDFTNRISQGKLREDVGELFASVRHRQLDIVLCAHGPALIPPRSFEYNCDIVLFKTSSSFERVRKKDVWDEETFEKVEKVRRHVNYVAGQARENDDSDERHYYGRRVVVTVEKEG